MGLRQSIARHRATRGSDEMSTLLFFVGDAPVTLGDALHFLSVVLPAAFFLTLAVWAIRD